MNRITCPPLVWRPHPERALLRRGHQGLEGTRNSGKVSLTKNFYKKTVRFVIPFSVKSRYFALPPGLLMPETAESRTNLFTALHQLKFAVLMWSPEVR